MTVDVSSFVHPPTAHGAAVGTGRLRATPEDFIVREWLGFEADGEGDHLLLMVRKRDANTHWVAKQLARIGKLHPRDVGFAGLKDRDAVSEQAFTVPLRSSVGADWTGVCGEGFEVLSCARHRRKLKRGALRGNAFVIVVRDWRGDADVLQQRLRTIASEGVPNYFGPQRFGREANNLRVAEAWFADGASPRDRFERGFALSVARAAIFNAVLGERVVRAAWNRLLPGELVNLDGSGSILHAESIDAVLEERCRILDVHPSGPLWGAGDKAPSGEAAALEQEVTSRLAELCSGLIAAGLEADRRPTRIRVSDLTWEIADDVVRLEFRLGRGAYATAVLHEIISNAFDQSVGEEVE
jgi:tRNA pseudouridine13 synthase